MEEQTKSKKTKENFNPLKKEIVEIRYIPSTSEMYSDPNTPLSGGLADTAEITYAVPSKNGMLAQVLTFDEQEFFERMFGMPQGTMSAMRADGNYWTTYGKGYINRVTLNKNIRRLDLSNPKDYIEWKILLTNTEHICPSQSAFENNRKKSYRFVMTNENAQAQSAGRNADIKLENFEIYAKYKEDANMLRTIIFLVEGKKVSPTTNIDMLKSKMVNLMETKAKMCNEVLTSSTLEQKKALIIGVEKSVISDRNHFYYVTETGQKLSADYEEPNLNNAANFLADVANQELYFSILKKIK